MPNKDYRTIKIKAETYPKLRLLAALTGESMIDLIDRLVTEATQHRQEIQAMTQQYDIVSIEESPSGFGEYQTSGHNTGDPVDLDEYIAEIEADGNVVYHFGVSPQIPDDIADIGGLIHNRPDELFATVHRGGVHYWGANLIK